MELFILSDFLQKADRPKNYVHIYINANKFCLFVFNWLPPVDNYQLHSFAYSFQCLWSIVCLFEFVHWELDYKESWAPKNWCFWTVVLEKTLESPLDWKEIQQLNPKGNQSWISLGRTDPKAETSILWPPAVKNRLIGCIPFSRESSQSRDWTQISHILYCLSHQWSPRQHIKKQRHRFADEGPSSQSYGFPSSHAQMTAGP